MDPRVRVLVAAAQLDRASYYDLLRVQPNVNRVALQQAWHRFALAYHPDRHVDEDPEIREATKKVYERGVEAYTVLRNVEAKAAYDLALSRGQMRLHPLEFERLSRESRKSPAPRPQTAVSRRPPLSDQSFAEQMTTDEGREIAERIDRLLGKQRYQDAYMQIGLLETVEPDNPAVKARGDKVAAVLRRRAR